MVVLVEKEFKNVIMHSLNDLIQLLLKALYIDLAVLPTRGAIGALCLRPQTVEEHL